MSNKRKNKQDKTRYAFIDDDDEPFWPFESTIVFRVKITSIHLTIILLLM